MQKKKIVSVTKSPKLEFFGSLKTVELIEPKMRCTILQQNDNKHVIYITELDRVVKVSTKYELGSDTLCSLKNEWDKLKYLSKFEDVSEIKYIQLPLDFGSWVDTDKEKIYRCIHYKYSDKGDAMDMVNNYTDHLIPKQSMDIMVNRVISQLLMGLTFFHERDILHGDIKLENILIVEGSKEEPEKLQIKIIDFESAKILKSGRFYRAIIKLGTTQCSAPESEFNNLYSHKSDMFAAGCTIYNLHTKKECPLKKNWYPSISGIKKKLREKEYHSTPRDKNYTKLILALVQREPIKRTPAKEALKILKKEK